MTKKLRVAGYCRTSSEAQKDNASIPNQKAAIERFASTQGWAVAGWYVDESRSGSKIEGRDAFQRLMRDAASGGRFDVVVVYDLTRFGRDGMDVLESARTLAREYSVHVVDTKGQFDTRDRSRTLSNFVTAGLTEDERLRILARTKEAKIRWARETGAPVTTKRPFGREWKPEGRKGGKQGKWVLIPEKKAMIEDCARRYLDGESLPKLAKEYGVNHANLNKVLRERCGPVWVQHVRCRDLNIDETIETQVPPLLDAQIIQQVRDRLTANRTYLHKPPKSVHEYLLSGRIFCGHCGYSLFGQTNPNGKRYYRHAHTDRKRECTLRPRPWVRADEVERAVVGDLFTMLGNPAAIERAISATVPDHERAVERRERLAAELGAIEKKRGRVVDAIADEMLTKAQAKKKLDELAGKEGELRAELGTLDTTLARVPDAEALRCFVELIGDGAGRAIMVYDNAGRDQLGGNDLSTFLELTRPERVADRRALIDKAFRGVLADGKPAGVYVEPAGKKVGRVPKFTFKLRGQLDFEVVMRHATQTRCTLPRACSSTMTNRASTPTTGSGWRRSPRSTPTPPFTDTTRPVKTTPMRI